MELELVAQGLQFPEGPIAMADGTVILVEIRRGTLSRVHPDGRINVIADLGGGPNGAAIGPDGAVYVCNNGGFNWIDNPTTGIVSPYGTPDDYVSGSIQRVDLATGAVSTLYDACDGRPLRGPNDIVFDSAGGFWFTDLGKNDGNVSHVGHLLYARSDGTYIRRARDRMVTPNGVGLSPDGRMVYVAETATGRLWAFGVAGPGELADPPVPGADRVFGPLPGYQPLDSLAVEADGRICVATIAGDGITIFDPRDGGYETIETPDPITTNICFGGENLRTAFITCSGTGRLFRALWPRPGLKLAFNA